MDLQSFLHGIMEHFLQKKETRHKKWNDENGKSFNGMRGLKSPLFS